MTRTRLQRKSKHTFYRLVNIENGKMEKNEMGGACSAYGEGESRVQGFGGEA